MATGTDNYEFQLINQFEGYVSSADPTNLSPNVLVYGSQNVYKKINGNIAVRPGLKRYGTPDATVAGIASSDEWYNSLGRCYPFRVIEETAAGNDGKLQVMSTIVDGETPVWYDLQTGLSLTRYVFDSWWDDTEKKDRYLFVRGDSNIYGWSGGISLAAAQGAGGSTLTKSDTTTTWFQDGFANNTAGDKKFKIYGSSTEYTYTGGETTTTLTGITPALPAINANDVIIQSVITSTNEPASGFTNDFIKTIGNQLHVGSYTSRLVYISSSTDFKDYTVPSPRTAGSPELLTLDNTVKGISVRQGKAHITAGLSDWYVVSYQDITVGTDLTQQTIVDKQETSALSAALAHEFIDTVGDDIIYLAQDQQMRNYGTFRNIITAKYPSLSQAVYTELQAEDFTGGGLKCIGDFTYITSPVSGKTYMYQSREALDGSGNIISERLWNPPQIWNASRMALINGVEYVHSNANPQIYQVWNTGQFHDDSPTDDPVPYDCSMCMSYQSHGRRQGTLEFSKVYVEGYVLVNSELNLRVRNDYLDQNPQERVLSSIAQPPAFFPNATPEVIGGTVIGVLPVGGGFTDETVMPKFRVIADVNLKDCFEYQLEIFSNTADSAWEILALGTDADMADDNATYIRR